MKLILALLSLMVLHSDAANVGGQLKNAQLENRGADYASGVRGRIWYRSDLGLCRYDDGSTIREFLTTNVSQTVTNKDIDGGTASNTSRVTLPKAATATLNALVRKEATVVYDTTTKEVKADNGSVLVPQMPVGTILHYGGSSAPNGYLLGDGAAVSRTTYAALFAVVSTAFGVGDGSTTFNLPNCQRRTLVGAGGVGSPTLPNTVGSTGGAENVTLIEANLPPHAHSSGTLAAGNNTTGISIPSSGAHSHESVTALDDTGGLGVTGFDINNSGDNSGFDAAPMLFISGGAHTHSVTDPGHIHSVTGSTGNGSGTSTNFSIIQPSLVVNCIIKH